MSPTANHKPEHAVRSGRHRINGPQKERKTTSGKVSAPAQTIDTVCKSVKELGVVATGLGVVIVTSLTTRKGSDLPSTRDLVPMQIIMSQCPAFT
jgi:hypothetical protein